MRIYDITLTISPDIPVWPGDPPVRLIRSTKMEEGADFNMTQLAMSAHTGTHVDAPFHFLGGSTATVEQLPLKILTGRAYVVHIPDHVNLITAPLLEKVDIPPRTRRLLFRTRNSQLWQHQEQKFHDSFVGVSPDGAEFLVNRGIKLIGVDYLSVAPFHDSSLPHQRLLQAGVVILEGLDLSQVSQGRYTLYCLPLKLAGADGAPARAILIGV